MGGKDTCNQDTLHVCMYKILKELVLYFKMEQLHETLSEQNKPMKQPHENWILFFEILKFFAFCIDPITPSDLLG